MTNLSVIRASTELGIAIDCLEKRWTPKELEDYLRNKLGLSGIDYEIGFEHISKLVEIYSGEDWN